MSAPGVLCCLMGISFREEAGASGEKASRWAILLALMAHSGSAPRPRGAAMAAGGAQAGYRSAPCSQALWVMPPRPFSHAPMLCKLGAPVKTPCLERPKSPVSPPCEGPLSKKCPKEQPMQRPWP